MEEYKGYKISIEFDPDPIDPRHFNKFCDMVVDNPPIGYLWGDRISAKRVEEIQSKAVLSVPLYALSYPEMHISTEPFNYPHGWRCGTAYVTEKTMIEWFGEETFKNDRDECLKKAKEIVNSEVVAYDHYISGEFFCYLLEDSKGNFLDGCCGFSDPTDAEAAAKASAEGFLADESPLFVFAGIDPWTLEETKKLHKGD